MTDAIAPEPLTDDDLDHVYALFYGGLNMCGCGWAEEAFTLVRDLLNLAPFYQGGRWRQAEEMFGHPGAYHLVLSALEHADVIEHGSSIGGSWLTPKGAHLRNLINRTTWGALDAYNVGFPHDGGDCTPDCWPPYDPRNDPPPTPPIAAASEQWPAPEQPPAPEPLTEAEWIAANEARREAIRDSLYGGRNTRP